MRYNASYGSEQDITHLSLFFYPQIYDMYFQDNSKFTSKFYNDLNLINGFDLLFLWTHLMKIAHLKNNTILPVEQNKTHLFLSDGYKQKELLIFPYANANIKKMKHPLMHIASR